MREYMRSKRGYREVNYCMYCGNIVQPGRYTRRVCDKCLNFKYRLRVYNHSTAYWEGDERLY